VSTVDFCIFVNIKSESLEKAFLVSILQMGHWNRKMKLLDHGEILPMSAVEPGLLNVLSLPSHPPSHIRPQEEQPLCQQQETRRNPTMSCHRKREKIFFTMNF